MTRLPWHTWDARGAVWRRRRIQAVAATVTVACVGLGGLTGTATPSRALEATADLGLLAQQRASEEAQLQGDHRERVARIVRDRDEKRQRAREAESADLTALGAGAAQRAAARSSALRDTLAGIAARRAEDLSAAGSAAARQREDVDRFFSSLLVALGPEGGTPSKTQLDTVKRSLESRRSSELSALSSAAGAARSLLEQQVASAVAALGAQLDAADAAHHAAKDQIADARARHLAAVDSALKALLGQLERDLLVLEQRHAQEELLLEDVHAAQTRAAATSSSAARSALDDRQKQEEEALQAQQEVERKEHDAAVTDAKADAATGKAARSAEAAAAEAAVDAAHDAAVTRLRAARDDAAATGSLQLKALTADHDAAYAALRATYDAAVSGVGKAHPGVRSAWTARVDRLAMEHEDARKAVTARSEVQERRAVAVDRAEGDAAARRHDHERKARSSAADAEVGQVDRDAKAAVKAADRDLSRRERLLRSEYWTLRLRAVAFTESSAAFGSVGAAFDPATDPGSLWNVARAIGATELKSTGAGVDIAHIDTGVVDVPGLAEADVEVGPDFSFDDAVPQLRGRDAHGHGTHLASIMVGRDAAWAAGDRKRTPERFLGIAPDARLLSVKAGAADGGVDVTQVIAAINWVIANRATGGRNVRVLTLAFGTDGAQDYRTDPLTHAVERAWQAGIVVVVSGGNDGWDASRLSNPAQDPYVLSVGAAQLENGRDYVPSSFSEGTAEGRTVDLSAPGRSIVALRSPGSFSDGENQAGRVGQRFVRGSGTSQSAAVVAGAAALLLAERPLLTPDQVKHLLTSTATRPDDDDSTLAGAGYLRVDKAAEASTPAVRQTWQRSTGTGSLDGARGSVRIARDGVVLEGQFDVFGRDWSSSAWTQDAWSASTWQGARWKDAQWAASGWDGARWHDAGWDGVRWKGTGWDGARWHDAAWDGARWHAGTWDSEAWSGARWKGARWHAGGWAGSTWEDGPVTTAVVGQEPVGAEAVAVAGTTP